MNVLKSWTADRLAVFSLQTRTSDIPGRASDLARRCLLDLIGAAAAGHGSDAAKAVRRVAAATFARGPARIWFLDCGMHPSAAAWANSAAASALDIDDGHRAAAGHPGAGIIPAVLAAAEPRTDWPDLLAAITIGYEVAVRISAGRDFSQQDTLSTGRWVAFGVAAAVSRLRRYSPETAAQALAIAGVLSPGVSAAGYSTLMGNHTKEGIPAATLTGTMAVDLAEAGYTGPLDILDHARYYDADRITDGLGEDFSAMGVYFKPYACCRWIHAALDAFFGLIDEHPQIADGSVEAIQVHTFERALRLNNETAPASVEGAQYSLPFCLATAALRGKAALLPMTADVLQDRKIARLARRVELTVDNELDPLFPQKTPARVVVVAAGRRYEATCTEPWGDSGNPMTWEHLADKFKILAAPCMTPKKIDEIIHMLAHTEHNRPQDLLNALAAP